MYDSHWILAVEEIAGAPTSEHVAGPLSTRFACAAGEGRSHPRHRLALAAVWAQTGHYVCVAVLAETSSSARVATRGSGLHHPRRENVLQVFAAQSNHSKDNAAACRMAGPQVDPALLAANQGIPTLAM